MTKRGAPRPTFRDCDDPTHGPRCVRVEHASGAVQHIAVRVITAEETRALLDARLAADRAAAGAKEPTPCPSPTTTRPGATFVARWR